MFLKKLINNLNKDKKNIKIKGISTNSKEVKKDHMFFAIQGKKINGEKYIDEAIKKGAVVIVCSKKCKYRNSKVTVIKVLNIRYEIYFHIYTFDILVNNNSCTSSG